MKSHADGFFPGIFNLSPMGFEPELTKYAYLSSISISTYVQHLNPLVRAGYSHIVFFFIFELAYFFYEKPYAVTLARSIMNL